jgi:membrane-bound lytic murein transglycosylase A
MTLRALAGWTAILLAAGCAQLPAPCPCPPRPKPPAEARYDSVDFAALPGWRAAPLAASVRAFVAGCARAQLELAMQAPCEAARSLPAGDEAAARAFFESAFSAYAIAAPDGAAEGTVTGYYEPVLEGSRQRSARYQQPVHGLPDDLVVVDLAAQYPELRGMRLRGRLNGRRVQPYWSRGEIAAGNGAFAAPAIAWVADPVELFFLQIQGSGQIQLDTGERIRVGFAEQNGHPYRSLGRLLVERGELALEQASMQGIKAWAAANPARYQEALNHNASYVFFRELPAAGGPIGALGVPLDAGYSIAVDPRYVPLGAPVFLATTYPLSLQPLERLVMAQDTGGAIRGAQRADFFWGTGPEAGALAGRMRQPGRMWVLWPRGAPLPRPLP